VTELVLAIDQGTSATKACVFEPPGVLLGVGAVPVSRRSPAPGVVEQDPEELVESCRAAARAALADAVVAARDVRAAALANQGESFVLFEDGDALAPVVGWQDTQTGDVLDRVRDVPGAAELIATTGLPPHAEFVAPKLAHRLQSRAVTPATRAGTLDTWLLHRLDPAAPLVSDRATASRTMLAGLEDTDWSPALLELFGIPRSLLAPIAGCDEIHAELDLDGTRIALRASSYDMGLALLGHACLAPGETKARFGTCLGVMTATGAELVRAHGLLTTVAYTLGGAPVYALDGEIAAAGSLVSWAIGLGIAGSLDELDALAATSGGAGGAVVVPAMSGLGAPHWRDDVLGAIVSLSEAVGRPQVAHAVLDAIAWSLRDVLAALERNGLGVAELRVDGGLTNSAVLMQRCADVCRTPIALAPEREATAAGAAALAMLAEGLVTAGDLRDAARPVRVFEPGAAPSDEEEARWQAALESVLGRGGHAAAPVHESAVSP
jgi:glycerol kinase